MVVWNWIIQAAKDVYSFVYTEIGTILGLLKDKNKKYSWKRITGIVAIYVAARFFIEGHFWSGVPFVAYAIVIAIMVGLEKA
jgi:hypothetical protein